MRYGKHYKPVKVLPNIILAFPVLGLLVAVWGSIMYLLYYIYRAPLYYGLLLLAWPTTGLPIGLIGLKKRWTEWLSVIDLLIGLLTLLMAIIFLVVVILSGRL